MALVSAGASENESRTDWITRDDKWLANQMRGKLQKGENEEQILDRIERSWEYAVIDILHLHTLHGTSIVS
jgi:hypothetical protein